MHNNKRRACSLNVFKKQPTRAAGKKILTKFTNVLKYIDMTSQQQTNKI